MNKLISSSAPLNARVRDRVHRAKANWTLSYFGHKLLLFFPITSWLWNYDISHSFFGDLSGGLTMAVFSVPQGIALAGITGVPPVYGLYTAIFPSFFYCLFASSKHNALGGFAVLSLMTHAAIENVMNRTAIAYNATAYVNHTLAELDDSNNDTAVLSNVTLMQMLGNETSFLEEITMEMWTEGVSPVKEIHIATTIMCLAGFLQVMSGFVVGGGIHVFFAQIGDILGIKLPRRNGPGYLYYRIYDLWESLDEIHYPTLTISLTSFASLVFGKEYLGPWLSEAFMFPVPFELILAVVGITATNYAELSRRHNIRVVGNIPTEFPPPSLPRLDIIRYVGLNAAAIAITAVAIHITVAKVVEKRYKYKIDHGQELYALGFVGMLSSFFPVFPVTSGFARSVVGAAVGGSTQLTCLFSSLALVAVILYIGPALEYLPQCILATMIIVSLKSTFIKFAELKHLWPVFKIDFAIWMMSFLLTVCYDMGEGLLLAIGFAVLTTILRTQRPRWHFLSRDEGTDTFRETKKKEVETVPGNVCIFRMDAPLIFTSVDRFSMSVWECVKKWEQSKREAFVTVEQMNAANNEDIFQKKAVDAKRRWRREGGRNDERCKLVIDCGGFPYVDYLGLTTLKSTYTDMMSVGIQTYFVVQKGDLKKLFDATDFYEEVPSDRVYRKLEDAVTEAESAVREEAKNDNQASAKDALTAHESLFTTVDDEENDEPQSPLPTYEDLPPKEDTPEGIEWPQASSISDIVFVGDNLIDGDN